jgi:hypothetical protein
MSCRYLTSGGNRCAVTLRYVWHLFKTSEMYASNGFIASPIQAVGRSPRKNAAGQYHNYLSLQGRPNSEVCAQS